jgi:hypothetical protein
VALIQLDVPLLCSGVFSAWTFELILEGAEPILDNSMEGVNGVRGDFFPIRLFDLCHKERRLPPVVTLKNSYPFL